MTQILVSLPRTGYIMVLTAPSAEGNERMINAILSKGLEYMMSDPGLLDFLKGQTGE